MLPLMALVREVSICPLEINRYLRSRIYGEQIDIFFDQPLLETLDRVMVEANWKAECTQGTVVNGQPPPSHTLLITSPVSDVMAGGFILDIISYHCNWSDPIT